MAASEARKKEKCLGLVWFSEKVLGFGWFDKSGLGLVIDKMFDVFW